MSANNYNIPITATDYLRVQEKRLALEQRRPMIRTASDLLGPGMGPYAVQTFDWNGDAEAFNGLWYSKIDAINGPNSDKEWIGQTIGLIEGSGIQLLHTFRAADWPPLEAKRAFTTGGGGRSYTDWIVV